MEQIQQGIETTQWMGRFETLLKHPRIIADGSHNRSAVEAFCSSVQRLYPSQKRILIIGMMHDKDYEVCIRLAASICDIVIGVHIGIERALSAKAVAETASSVLCGRADGGNLPAGACAGKRIVRRRRGDFRLRFALSGQ